MTWADTPATQSIRLSGHQNNVWMANGSSSTMSAFSFSSLQRVLSNALAVFSLYRTWSITLNRKFRSLYHQCKHIKNGSNKYEKKTTGKKMTECMESYNKFVVFTFTNITKSIKPLFLQSKSLSLIYLSQMLVHRNYDETFNSHSINAWNTWRKQLQM